ncbi:hypothetical protein BB560_000718 [Smittium megazygosporum]|uniref:Cleavage stimulation factor subunit 2 hinge domain-containing protein n=1 Tax=Smittium megazygosporum TaxID=133381 RepID=A0A2T9ZJK4_9FUNG|nr:hypothetical protein BB560_000718 [Smittium megazygosporum]
MDISGRKIKLDYADPNSLKRSSGNQSAAGNPQIPYGTMPQQQAPNILPNRPPMHPPQFSQGQIHGNAFPFNPSNQPQHLHNQNVGTGPVPNQPPFVPPRLQQQALFQQQGYPQGQHANVNYPSGKEGYLHNPSTGPGESLPLQTNQMQSQLQFQQQMNQPQSSAVNDQQEKPSTLAISEIISSLSQDQKKELLCQMKESAMVDKSQTMSILRQSPQLAYALFHTMVELGLLDGPSIQNILQPSLQQPPNIPPPQHQPQFYPPPPPPGSLPPPNTSNFPR